MYLNLCIFLHFSSFNHNKVVILRERFMQSFKTPLSTCTQRSSDKPINLAPIAMKQIFILFSMFLHNSQGSMIELECNLKLSKPTFKRETIHDQGRVQKKKKVDSSTFVSDPRTHPPKVNKRKDMGFIMSFQPILGKFIFH